MNRHFFNVTGEIQSNSDLLESNPLFSMKESKKEAEAGNQVWIITFADLISLLLTFFIMIYAMSSLNMVKWEQISEVTAETGAAISESPEKKIDDAVPEDVGEAGTAATRYALADLMYRRTVDLQYLQVVLDGSLKNEPALKNATLTYANDRLTLRLSADLVFLGDSLALAPEGEKTLASLGGIVRSISNKISITSYFMPGMEIDKAGAGWEFAIKRASKISETLRSLGYGHDIGITAAAEANRTDGSSAVSQYISVVIFPGVAE